MRILLFLDTDHLSGPARLALDFCVQARRLGHEVLMLGLVRGSHPESTPFLEAMRQAGIPTRLLHERFRFDPGVIRQFRQVLTQFQPDLYQSHGYKGSLLGRIARRQHIPWQAIFHGFTWENWRVRFYHALDVRWLRQANEVIVVSKAFGEHLCKKGITPTRVRWVPNAISEENLRSTDSGEPLRNQWSGSGAGQPLLVGVLGRFSPEKAPDHFLRAFLRAAQERPFLRGVMVGEGPLWSECRELSQRLAGEGKIIMPGFRADLASIYAALDMLVIPSRSEGMPTVLIEAMLMGVPVVSTRVGAVPDVVRDGQTALLVPIGDEAALAEAIGRLADDADLRRRMAGAAQQLARQRLTVQERTRTLLAHAECLLAGRPLPDVVWNGTAHDEHNPTESTPLCSGQN